MTQKLYKLWVFLLIVSGGIALCFSAIAAYDLWKFVRLDAQTAAEVVKWDVHALPSSRFAIEAVYQYEVKGNFYTGKTIFESPCFFNHFAAENYLKTVESTRWTTWYRKGNPALSSLEREFPQKQCLQALLTVGVFAYFYFARALLTKAGICV